MPRILRWVGITLGTLKRLGQMTDDELKAIWLYLQSLKGP